MKRSMHWACVMTAGLMWVGCQDGAADPLSGRYTYLAPSDGDYEDEVEQHEFRIREDVPVLSPEEYGFALDIGGVFQANVWQFDADNVDDLDLYKFILPLTATFQATPEIPMVVMVAPGIHSDFEDVDGEDFRVDGAAFGSYAYSETVTFVLGAGFGEEFGDPQAYPIGGVKWAATPELQLDLVFPTPRITYTLSDDYRVYAAGEPAGGEWNVGDQDQQVDVSQEGYRVGLGVEYQVAEDGWFYAAVGAEVERKLSAAVDENTVVDEQDLEDATFVQVGFHIDY